MNSLINAVSKHLGPKITGVLAGVTTAFGQIERSIANSAYEGVGAMDVVINALATGDIMAMLPAPAAAVIGYFARKSDNPARVIPVEKPDELGINDPSGTVVESDPFRDYMDERLIVVERKLEKIDYDLREDREELHDIVMFANKKTTRDILALQARVDALEAPQNRAVVDVPLPAPELYDWKYSKRSLDNLSTVHFDLAAVAELALTKSKYDFIVISGRRTQDEQDSLVRLGKSRTRNSRHIHGLAIDIAILLEDGNVTWEFDYYIEVSKAFMAAAKELNIDITWGGDWPTFRDGVHFELNRDVYPDNSLSQ